MNNLILKIYQFLIVLGLVFLIQACGDSPSKETETTGNVVQNPIWGEYQKTDNPLVKLELVDSIAVDTPDDLIISGMNYFATDTDGNMYFFDRQQSKLISVAPDGSVRWMTGQKGRGPGDFENVYSMLLYKDELLIGNIRGSRIDRFDLSGNFIATHTFEKDLSLAHLQGISDDGTLVVSTPLWGGIGYHIHVLDFKNDSLPQLNEFAIDQTEDLKIGGGMSSSGGITYKNQQIISGSPTDYSLTTYDLEGNVIHTITRDFDKIVPPGFYSSGGSSSMWSFGGVGSPLIFPNGYFIVYVQWPTNVSDPNQFVKASSEGEEVDVVYRNSVDFYAPSGKLLYSIETEGDNPEMGRITYVDQNGIAYITSSNPEPVIYRYRLIVPES